MHVHARNDDPHHAADHVDLHNHVNNHADHHHVNDLHHVIDQDHDHVEKKMKMMKTKKQESVWT